MPAIRLAPRDTSFEQPAMAETPMESYAGTLVYDSLYHSPVGTFGIGGGPEGGIGRMTNLFFEKHFGTTDKISPQEANKNYGLDGELNFSEPVYEGYAQLLHDRKLAEIRRNYEMASGSVSGWGRRVSGFGISLASQVLDPVNLASMFMPVVGESKLLSGTERAGSFLMTGLISPKTVAKIAGTSPLRYRLAKGSLEGLVGTALVEPFNVIPSIQEQADYNFKDSAVNIMFGGIMGGVLHAGFGALADKLGPILERQFAGVHMGLKSLDPQTPEAAFHAALSDMVEDKPITSASDLVSVDTKVVESELQQANTRQLFDIANEHLDRLEQLYLQGKLTPQQEMRRKILGAMLRNPTDATPENLASMFNLKLNDDIEKMPGAYAHVNPEDRVKASENVERPIVPYDRTRYQFFLNEIHAVGERIPSDDLLPHEYIKDHPKDFEALIKKLHIAGYDVVNPRNEIKMGAESIAILTQDGKAVKISLDRHDTIPGVGLTPEFQTKQGIFHARVVDQVTPMSEHLETPAIKQAMSMLAEKYGLNPDDLGHWNLGMKDGRIHILDEGAMRISGEEKEKVSPSSSPEANAVYQQLLKQIEEQKAKVKQIQIDKVQQLIEKRKNQKPEPEKVVSDKDAGLKEPIKQEPEPIRNNPLSEEDQKNTEKELADLQKESDELEKELSLGLEKDKSLSPDIDKADEMITKMNKVSKALEAGANCLTKKII